MMKLFFTLLLAGVAFLSNGQCPAYRYTYDNVGNRIARRYVWCIQDDDVLKKEAGKTVVTASDAIEMTIYPNPNDGHFDIQFSNPVADAWLELYDMTGHKLLTQKGDKQTLDASTFAVGSYWLMYRNEQKILGKSKVLIQK
jgi:Secretion system C-terminal sorting domain